jgi:hypothetical protein
MQEKINALTAAAHRAQIDMNEAGAFRLRIWKGKMMQLPEVHCFNAPTLEEVIDQAFEKLIQGAGETQTENPQ